MNFAFGQRYVVVNLPATFAEAVENDHVVRRYRVIVGKTEKPSPTLTAEITSVNLNPTWTVPSSIAKTEISAHMRKDPTYLARMHMEVLDAHDAPIDPHSVDWSGAHTPNFTVRQQIRRLECAGRGQDRHAESLFGLHARHQPAQSVQRRLPLRLARLLARRQCARPRRLAAAGGDAEMESRRDRCGDRDRRARRISALPKKVPVAWIYLTAWMTQRPDRPVPQRHLRPGRAASGSHRRGSGVLQPGRQSSADGASGAVGAEVLGATSPACGEGRRAQARRVGDVSWRSPLPPRSPQDLANCLVSSTSFAMTVASVFRCLRDLCGGRYFRHRHHKFRTIDGCLPGSTAPLPAAARCGQSRRFRHADQRLSSDMRRAIRRL